MCHNLLILLDPTDPWKEANATIASMNRAEIETNILFSSCNGHYDEYKNHCKAVLCFPDMWYIHSRLEGNHSNHGIHTRKAFGFTGETGYRKTVHKH
jgi:hypothetical protein